MKDLSYLTELPASIHRTENNQATVPENKTWSGHVVACADSLVSLTLSTVKETTATVIGVVQGFFHLTGSLFNEASVTADMVRRVDRQILPAIEDIRKTPGAFDKMRANLGPMIGAIDAIQWANDLDYIANGRYHKDSNLRFTGRLAIMFANSAGTILWLREMGFNIFSNFSAALGEVRLFSFVPKVVDKIPKFRDIAAVQRVSQVIGDFRVFSILAKIPLVTLVTKAVTFGYACFAVNSFVKMINAKTTCAMTQAFLDMAYFISEVALDVLITIGALNSLVGLGIVGCSCLTFGLLSFIHKVNHKKELENV